MIKECIVGAVEARFGSLTKKPDPTPAPNSTPRFNADGKSHANGSAKNGMAKTDPACSLLGTADPKDAGVSDCCGDGIAENTAPLVSRNGHSVVAASGEPRNFEEFINKVWGAGIAKHFAIPYNRKIWAVPLDTM